MLNHGRKTVSRLLTITFIGILLGSTVTVAAEDGFKSIFDGKTLEGWDGNPKFWRVEEGAITGQTTKENPTKGNTFAIFKGDQPGDFELRMKFKIVGGNSGIQYRSKDMGNWVVGGYQADIDSGTRYSGILYDERGRGIIADRGQKTIVTKSNGKSKVTKIGSVGDSAEIQKVVKNEEWNDYIIIARGNQFTHIINGRVTSECIDDDPSGFDASGVIALQLHAGPPMKVQFKDIRIKHYAPHTASAVQKKKIVFVAGRRSHNYGSHEHYAGCVLLAKYLERNMPGYQCEVFKNGWPNNGMEAFEGADAVVVYCDGGGGHVLNPHIDEFDKIMDEGVGLVCLHYGVETPKGKTGNAFLDWMGGYFETHWSVNPHWTAKFEKYPAHPIASGVQPFEINDEWYFHMRFRDGMQGVTPILSAHPPQSTMKRRDGTHSGNPAVRRAVADGEIQHVAWAAERPGGGRGFGFTGGHVHWNWGDDNFRKVVLNAIVWTAKGTIPENGVGGPTPTRTELEQNQDYPKPGEKKAVAQKAQLPKGKAAYASPAISKATKNHSVDIDVEIKGAKKLYLVVTDGGNGYGFDWADWIEPRLVGPDGEKKLTELKWKNASSDWGQVRIGNNAGGGKLRVNGKPVTYGIGTHANSVIEYDLPAGYTRFKAQGGLDNGGTDQGGGNDARVNFMVYTSQPPKAVTAGRNAGSADRSPDAAVGNLEVHPELQASLFAAEPLLLSPSNIDIDHRGRVWVCEIVNYRRHREKRKEGDRILILEDTDGDGKADKQKVFYQGRDIDSPHGVCVLGNKVIVSAGSKVQIFTDEDGDDKPDRKEDFFTGISGTQHDHGIHEFMFGPDGKLYFNFGNEGRQLMDAKGNPITDMAGNVVKDNRQPYQQGMVFRCNMDGSQFETLGWNFRNNWMATVDSFGTIWQSDNDDDGNRGVRINYVMEFGNYGYRDEFTGAGWRQQRTGWEATVPERHWHLNDPGVVPNLLQTGGGSPTGIMVYEGDLLPKIFHGQMIHCDAGPSVVRAYPVKESGAGYSAEIVNVLQGASDNWFRPSDVKCAPDGSIIVADWYDPGVGGHGMGDLNRGRIFRVTPKGHDNKYKVPKYDLTTATGAVEALKNPNASVRYLAWAALNKMGAAAEPALREFWMHKNPRYRARALWLLGKIPGRGKTYVEQAISEADSDIRVTGLRLSRQLDSVDTMQTVRRLANDPSAKVRRECAIAIRHNKSPLAAQLWAELASQYDGKDRWYLEALGIAADKQWDTFLAKWLESAEWDTPAGHDIIWRSRATQTPELIAKIVRGPAESKQLPRYFRAIDFLGSSGKTAITQFAFSSLNRSDDDTRLIRSEAFRRLSPGDLNDPANRASLRDALKRMPGSPQFVELVDRFNVEEEYPALLELAKLHPSDQLGVNAVTTLLKKNRKDLIASGMSDENTTTALIRVLGNCSDNRAVELLDKMVKDDSLALETRRQAVSSEAKIKNGAMRLLRAAKAQRLDRGLNDALALSLTNSRWNEIREPATKLFPQAKTKDAKLPSIQELLRKRGDAERGHTVFNGVGTCSKCHIVNGKGKEVGPSLTEIGSKLSRQGMYEAILYPSAAISHNYASYLVETDEGNSITGLLTSKTDEAVTITNAEGIAKTIPMKSVDVMEEQSISLMPANLNQLMSEQELVDVVEYALSLKKN